MLYILQYIVFNIFTLILTIQNNQYCEYCMTVIVFHSLSCTESEHYKIF